MAKQIIHRLCVFAATLVLVGCGPDLEREEFGKVHYKLPDVPGAEKPYDLPALDGEGDAGDEPDQGRQQ